MKLAANISGYVAATAEIGQNNAAVYGGQAGLNVAFNASAVAPTY